MGSRVQTRGPHWRSSLVLGALWGWGIFLRRGGYSPRGVRVRGALVPGIVLGTDARAQSGKFPNRSKSLSLCRTVT